MTEHSDYIARLLTQCLLGEATQAQLEELKRWAAQDARRQAVLAEYDNTNELAMSLNEYLNADTSAIGDRLKQVYPDISFHEIGIEETERSRQVHRIHFLKTAWFRYAAAILIIFGIGAYFYSTQQKPLITATKPVPVKNDILPGTNRAILTLSNGQQIELDSAAPETIHDQTLSIENKNGQLIYFNRRSPGEGGKKSELVAMNTMTTPKGGQYQLTLADGTKVWLNAASSITYPTAFFNNTREVAITGEAYLEVIKNKSRPFIVKSGKETITVLGTSFNVNHYADEPAVKISLIEGAVKVNESILVPGQAYVSGRIMTTNIEQDIAWKNGIFNFSDASLPVVLRQLARWYDLEIRYEGEGTDKKLIGKLSRNLPLSEVIKTLQYFKINFRMEGRTLIVQ